MAQKPVLPTLTNTGNVQSQLTTINEAFRDIEDEFEKMLSREDASLPNHMLDSLDMNGYKVLNVSDGTEGADAVNKSQLDTKENFLGLPSEDGMVLAGLKTGLRYWTKGGTGGGGSTPTSYFDQVDFNTSSLSVGAPARLVWNDVDGTLDLGLKGGNVTMQLGQEQFIRIVNKTGAVLLESAYQCVKLDGAQGQRPKIALAQANSALGSAETIGIVTETIADNGEGFVTTSGLVRGINTTGSLQGETWVDGDVLYLSPTTAGQLTKTKPSAPNKIVVVAYVIYAHANQGKLFVKVSYEDNLTLTTTGSSGAATLVNGVLNIPQYSGGGSGTVTSVAVSSTNGFAATVTNPTTTPSISIETTITGLLKGNGTSVSAASAGTDYVPITGTGATGTWGIGVTGNAGTVTNGVYTSGNQTIAGIKTFSSTISGSIEGNAATATNATKAGEVNNTRDSSSVTIWTGSQAQYDAIGSKISSTLYFIT